MLRARQLRPAVHRSARGALAAATPRLRPAWSFRDPWLPEPADPPSSRPLWLPEPVDPSSPRPERNLQRTCDVLRSSYPTLFEGPPDLTIYRPDIEFHALHHTPGREPIAFPRLHGIDAYRRLFDGLRLARRTTVVDSDLSYTLSVDTDDSVRVRWHAQLWLRLPLPPVLGVGHTDAPLCVDGVSYYELDAHAQVRVHRLEYVERLVDPMAGLTPAF